MLGSRRIREPVITTSSTSVAAWAAAAGTDCGVACANAGAALRAKPVKKVVAKSRVREVWLLIKLPILKRLRFRGLYPTGPIAPVRQPKTCAPAPNYPAPFPSPAYSTCHATQIL